MTEHEPSACAGDGPASPLDGPSREERLAEVIATHMDSLARGEKPDAARTIAEHPDLAPELERELGTLDCMTSAIEAQPLGEKIGDYLILREVGRGGMGIVYEAEQASLGRRVALKVLPLHATLDKRQLERFRREAQAVAGLHHINIVAVYEIGEENGLHYYTMQFIDGQGLHEVIEEIKRLRVTLDKRHAVRAATSPSLRFVTELSSGTSSGSTYSRGVARLGLQVAEALAYAHGEGILHRDIKPSNLLLDQRGTLWVADFGLAKVEGNDGLTSTGDTVGTLAYMAPERFAGWSDHRADIYSLGLTLYELLTLTPAFQDSDRARLMRKVSEETPPRPRRLDPNVPRDLETIVLKAMAREPGQRYQTAKEMAQDLRLFVEERPIQARRVSGPERLWRWCRRKPALASLAAMVVLLLLAVAVITSFNAWQLREQLWTSYLAQAGAGRLSGRAGRRFQSLEAVARAAAIRPSFELRNEAIACLAQADLRVAREWPHQTRVDDGLLAFDAALERYATDGGGGAIVIRRLEDNRETGRIACPDLLELILDFSPDGNFLAAKHIAKGVSLLRMWDLNRSAILWEAPDTVNPWGTDFSFSPDSRRVAAGVKDGSLVLFDAVTGHEEKRMASVARPHVLAFHPDGKELAVSSLENGDLLLLDLETGGVLKTFHHEQPAFGVGFGAGGKLLAAASKYSIFVWRTETGELQTTLQGHLGEVIDVVFNHAGDLLASAGWDGTARLWNPWTGDAFLSIRASRIYNFSADDRRLGFELWQNVLGAWEVDAGRECRSARCPGRENQSRDAKFSPDGNLITVASDQGLALCDPARFEETALLPLLEPGLWHSAILEPDGGALIASGRPGLCRWPILRAGEAGRERVRLGPGETICDLANGKEVALSPNGDWLAVADGDRGQAIVFDWQGGRRKTATVSHPRIETISLSPDGSRLATGTWQGSGVKVWETASGKLLQEFPAGSAVVIFSPDGRWLVIGTEIEYGFRETNGWTMRHRIPSDGSTGPLAFSADGKVLSVGIGRTTVGLIDPEAGREIARLEAPNPQLLTSLAFSPDGGRLVVGSKGAILYVWDLRRIRSELAELGLDWKSPVLAPGDAPARP